MGWRFAAGGEAQQQEDCQGQGEEILHREHFLSLRFSERCPGYSPAGGIPPRPQDLFDGRIAHRQTVINPRFPAFTLGTAGLGREILTIWRNGEQNGIIRISWEIRSGDPGSGGAIRETVSRRRKGNPINDNFLTI